MTPILDTIRSILDTPSATLRAQEALQRTMTGRVLMQPPIMTSAHRNAMTRVCSLWPYHTEADPQLLRDIAAHLDALLTAPVPTRCEPLLDDWTATYAPLDMEVYQSDQ